MKVVYVLMYEKEIYDGETLVEKAWVPYAVFENIKDCDEMKRPGDKCFEIPMIPCKETPLNADYYDTSDWWTKKQYTHTVPLEFPYVRYNEQSTGSEKPKPSYTVTC